MGFLPAIAGLFLFVGMACSHDHHNENDASDPQIIWESPVADFSVAGVVNIKGKVTDETSLHEMSVVVKNDSDGTEIFKSEPEVHDKLEYIFDENWTPTGLAAEQSVTLTIVVEDHADHKTSKTIKFKVKP